MNTINKLSNIIILLIFISGCASTASGPSFHEGKAAYVENEHALVYVYRKYAEPTAWGATINIDGKEVSTLNEGGFTWFYAKPGKRLISAVWSSMASQSDAKLSITLSPSNTYYVELTGVSRVDLVGVSSTGRSQTQYIDVDINSGLQQVKNKYAETTLDKCCKYQGSRSKHY